jgi:hypothetical protein
MAKPCNCPYSQAIPEAAKEGHLPEFCGPRGDEDIGLDALKNPEQEWDVRRIMLTIGIQSDDHLIVLAEDRLKPRPQGGTLSEIKGMSQELDSVF